MSFHHLQLNPKLLEALEHNQFKKPTAIQQSVIPHIISGKDIMASAETGAGKTMAFVLPALHNLLSTDKQGKGPKVLILTPTRELANQVTEAVKKLAKFTHFKIGVITGGVPYFAQEQLLRNRLDILIATPGRLMDHMNQNRVNFSDLELLILDEADRMLDMGFIGDIEMIIDPMPSDRQVLLFSATLEGEVLKIANRFLKNPEKIQLNDKTKLPTLITQHLHAVDNYNHKQRVLAHLLEDSKMWQAIVFTSTKRSAEDLASELFKQKIACAALHGDMKQPKRTRTLERMKNGKLRVLIATDVAARGIDVKTITHVINFDLPRKVEDYIHRIGRTGRNGESGTAISLVGPDDWRLVSQIEKVIGLKIKREMIEGLEPKTKEPNHKDQKSNNFKHKPWQNKRTNNQGSFKDRAHFKDRGSFKDRTHFKDRDPLKDRASFKDRTHFKDRDQLKDRASFKNRTHFKDRDQLKDRANPGKKFNAKKPFGKKFPEKGASFFKAKRARTDSETGGRASSKELTLKASPFNGKKIFFNNRKNTRPKKEKELLAEN